MMPVAVGQRPAADRRIWSSNSKEDLAAAKRHSKIVRDTAHLGIHQSHAIVPIGVRPGHLRGFEPELDGEIVGNGAAKSNPLIGAVELQRQPLSVNRWQPQW